MVHLVFDSTRLDTVLVMVSLPCGANNPDFDLNDDGSIVTVKYDWQCSISTNCSENLLKTMNCLCTTPKSWQFQVH